MAEALERGRRRRIELKQRLGRMIWTEAEPRERERLDRDLAARLLNAQVFEGFADDPLDAHIARLRAELGLEPKPDANPAHPGSTPSGGGERSSGGPDREGDPGGGPPDRASASAALPDPGSARFPAFAGMGEEDDEAPEPVLHPFGSG